MQLFAFAVRSGLIDAYQVVRDRLGRRTWTIPRARTKTDRGDHFVPLSDLAVELLREQHDLTGVRLCIAAKGL